jgi:hypothetical protein
VAAAVSAIGGQAPVRPRSTVGGSQQQLNERRCSLHFDRNIGAPVISGWIITMDLAHQRLWIAPARAKN